MKDLEKYIKEILNVDLTIFPLEKSICDKLPFYIKASYALHETNLLGQRICLLSQLSSEESGLTPDHLAKQVKFLNKQVGFPVVFVFDKIVSYNLKRMIDKGISFIIPNKQLFIPSLLTDLRKAPDYPQKQTIKLTSMSQFLLLYHLQQKPLTGQTALQLSTLLAKNYKIINRAIKNLEELGLCQLIGGKEKYIQFVEKGKNLWTMSQKFFQTPVERVFYTDELLQTAIKSNINALAHYTMLNDEPRFYFAIDKFAIKTMDISTNKYIGNNTIEVWRYNPVPLSNDGFIDKLSLYLLLKNAENKRIQTELEKMINHIQWLETSPHTNYEPRQHGNAGLPSVCLRYAFGILRYIFLRLVKKYSGIRGNKKHPHSWKLWKNNPPISKNRLV
jgi:hypothetical protein